jgi:hypothetical protein
MPETIDDLEVFLYSFLDGTLEDSTEPTVCFLSARNMVSSLIAALGASENQKKTRVYTNLLTETHSFYGFCEGRKFSRKFRRMFAGKDLVEALTQIYTEHFLEVSAALLVLKTVDDFETVGHALGMAARLIVSKI